MYWLDTNVIIQYWNKRHPLLTQRFDREIKRSQIVVSIITVFELRYGVAKSQHRERNQARFDYFFQLPVSVVEFDIEDAAEAGEIRATLERAGTPIGPYDVLIAAQARRRSAVLVKGNSGEFARVPGLAIENWAE